VWLEHGQDRAGTRDGPGFASTFPHEGNNTALHPHLFGGGVGPHLRETPGLASLLDRHRNLGADAIQ